MRSMTLFLVCFMAVGMIGVLGNEGGGNQGGSAENWTPQEVAAILESISAISAERKSLFVDNGIDFGMLSQIWEDGLALSELGLSPLEVARFKKKVREWREELDVELSGMSLFQLRARGKRVFDRYFVLHLSFPRITALWARYEKDAILREVFSPSMSIATMVQAVFFPSTLMLLGLFRHAQADLLVTYCVMIDRILASMTAWMDLMSSPPASISAFVSNTVSSASFSSLYVLGWWLCISTFPEFLLDTIFYVSITFSVLSTLFRIFKLVSTLLSTEQESETTNEATQDFLHLLQQQRQHQEPHLHQVYVERRGEGEEDVVEVEQFADALGGALRFRSATVAQTRTRTA